MRVKMQSRSNQLPYSSFLPLEIFDNTEYDCRTPADWLSLGLEQGIRKPVPGKAFLPCGNHLSICLNLLL